jgi:glycosyltransferase involved in cell wall biosynthesis
MKTNLTLFPRVCFITNFISPYRASFFEKLCAIKEYEWLVIHGKKGKEDGRPSYHGSIHFPNFEVEYFESKIGPFSIRWQKGIIQRLNDWKPEVVITLGIPSILSNWLAMRWARKHGAKVITWHAGWESQAGNRLILPIKHLITKIYLSMVDIVLVYSTKGKNYLTSIKKSKSSKMIVCYNGLEIDPLINKEEIIEAGGKELRHQLSAVDMKIFLYVGGLIEEKKVPLLLQAFSKLPDSSKNILWIVGDGPDSGKVNQLAKNLDLKNVKFWGRVIEDVDIYFSAADFFVMPGVGGLALNQAMFWKLPCIVSEADGTEDDLVIDSKTGFRFLPDDEKSLVLAMQKCLQLSDDERTKMGSLGQNLVVERSNVNEMVKTFITTIHNLATDGTR